jgi:septin family protein
MYNNKDNKIDNKKGKKLNSNNGKKGNMIEKNNPNKGISSHKYDYIFNILLIGEEGVGKTEFLLKFTDKFTANHRETISK